MYHPLMRNGRRPLEWIGLVIVGLGKVIFKIFCIEQVEYLVEVSCYPVVTCKLFHVCVSFLDSADRIRYYVGIHSA